MRRSLRVLHCPMLVGGNAAQLARSERAIGLDSWAVCFQGGDYGYPCDEVLWTDSPSAVRRELSRWSLLLRAAVDFDVVHFNFGTPILPSPPGTSGMDEGILQKSYGIYRRVVGFRDLALLRLSRKAIFVTYQGDDARQADYCLANFRVTHAREVGTDYYPSGSDQQKRRNIAFFDRYANGIYALNPDLLHVLPPRARFLPYGHIDLQDWKPTPKAGNNGRLRVVHAPSHQGAKGTRYVVDAANRLKAEGLEFDFIMAEHLSNTEVRKVIGNADLVIDQLLVGWYGGLAVESMALAKPVVCYLREDDLRFVDSEMGAQLPIIRAEPDTVYEVLKQCITAGRGQLAEIGSRGRSYVERWHDPVQIARRLRDDYEAALKNAEHRA